MISDVAIVRFLMVLPCIRMRYSELYKGNLPKLNAMTALCTMTAIKMDIRFELTSCKPIAKP